MRDRLNVTQWQDSAWFSLAEKIFVDASRWALRAWCFAELLVKTKGNTPAASRRVAGIRSVSTGHCLRTGKHRPAGNAACDVDPQSRAGDGVWSSSGALKAT
jgi:hypothetical protein